MQRFADMSEQEFQNVIDGYIDRVVADEVEVPAIMFLDLLAQQLRQQVDQTKITLVDIENDDAAIEISLSTPATPNLKRLSDSQGPEPL